MRKPFKWSVLLAAMLFGFTMLGGTGVGAQDAEEFSPADLEGIQYANMRSYSIDYSSLMDGSSSTPGVELSMPEGLLGLNAVVIEFDDDGNAEKGFDTLVEQFESDESFTEGAEDEWDIDLGNKSKSLTGTEETEGVETTIGLTVVQEDNYVYFVSAYGSDFDAQDTLKQYTEKMLDNDGSGEGEFSEDGTSTGGLWDKFPAADDELVSDLTVYDAVLYPETEGDDA